MRQGGKPSGSAPIEASNTQESLEKEFGELAKLSPPNEPDRAFTEKEQWDFYGLELARKMAKKRDQVDTYPMVGWRR